MKIDKRHMNKGGHLWNPKGSLNPSWKNLLCSNEEWFYYQYIVQNKTLREIAKEIGCGLRTVSRCKQKFGFTKKQYKKIKPKKVSPDFTCPVCGGYKSRYSKRCARCYFNSDSNRGINNVNFKGLVDIKSLLRHYIKYHLRTLVFERDGYRCQECGDTTGGNLNAHHIIQLSIIVDKIIDELDFDENNINDRLDVVKLLKDNCSINDLNNMITVCDKCHSRIHHIHKNNSYGSHYYRYKIESFRVVDGDTIESTLEIGFGSSYKDKFRLLGINTPEIKGISKKEGYKSKKRLEYLMNKANLLEILTFKNIGTKGKGKYGRYLIILLCDGVNINNKLLKEGYAVKY